MAGRGGHGKGGPSPAVLTSVIKKAWTVEDLLSTFAAHSARFNHIHLSACWSTLGHLTRSGGRSPWEEHPEALRPLAQHTVRAVRGPEFRGRELANIAHGAAKSGAASCELLAAVAAAAKGRVGECNAQELANVAWAFAKAQHDAPELFDAIARRATSQLRDFKAQELSNLAWAYATAKHSAPALYDAVAKEAAPRLREFNEQALSNTFWAYATAKHDAPGLFDAIATQVASRPSELTPQALSTIAWAGATTRRCTGGLLDAVAGEAKRRLRQFTAQQLSNLVWAFAKADHSDAGLFAALAESVSRRLGDFNSQDLANTAWALAKACHVDDHLFAAMARSTVRCVEDFNLQDLVNTAWAFAKVGHYDTALFAALTRSIVGRRLDDLDVPHVANIAWAFSKAVQPPDTSLFAALASSTERRVGDLSAQDLSTVAWAFANAGQLDARLFRALAGSAERLLDGFSDEERDNAEWAFAQAGQGRIAKQLRQRRARAARNVALAEPGQDGDPAAAAPACGRIVVVGCGIGGAAAAVALQRRGFDVVVLEADGGFDARKQGYGLTIQGQEATQAIGVSLAEDDAPSTSHYTFSAEGHILGFFGEAFGSTSRDRREIENSGRFVHIPRQRLRARLVEQVRPGTIRWSSKLRSFSCWSDDRARDDGENGVTVTLTDGSTIDAALLVASDGIFSTVRHQLDLPGDRLNYVGLVVVLGIVPTVGFGGAGAGAEGSPVVAPLAQRRIFETVDGTTRIYAMPFTTTSTMWQLSFPYPEKAARALVKDAAALKAEILRRCGGWHAPIPALLRGTPLEGMSGYPVYDRQLLEPHALRDPAAAAGTPARQQRRVTLIGDAAHPMTPFKAQGANQALSDAVLLADSLAESIRRHGPSAGIDAALPAFERKMLSRSSRVVVGSREKAKELHSALALQPARKVQRDAGNGAADMQAAIDVLRAEGVSAHSAADPRGLDAVVQAAVAPEPRRAAVVETRAAAGGLTVPTKKRKAKDAAVRSDSGNAKRARDGPSGVGGFEWDRAIHRRLGAAGTAGMRRKELRNDVIRRFHRHVSHGRGADRHREGQAATPAELRAVFREHLRRARAAGMLSTHGKLVRATQ